VALHFPIGAALAVNRPIAPVDQYLQIRFARVGTGLMRALDAKAFILEIAADFAFVAIAFFVTTIGHLRFPLCYAGFVHATAMQDGRVIPHADNPCDLRE
jgi:hypothetical protein